MFTSAAPLFLSFFTSSAPGYTGSPSPSTIAASFVFTVIPPKGVAIFTLSLPFLLSDSIRQPLIKVVTAISVATTTTVWLFRISRLHIFTKNNTPLSPRQFHFTSLCLDLHSIQATKIALTFHFPQKSSNTPGDRATQLQPLFP